MQVIKRDGYTEEFNINKVSRAVRSAFREVGEVDDDEISKISNDIKAICEYEDVPAVDIEVVQDLIEEKLIERGHTKVAKAFILYRQKRTEARKKGWELDELQQSIFDRKYNIEGLTFDKWLDRVSGDNPKVRKLIRDKKFIFAGRILAHRGVDKKVTYSNCYVMTPPEDSLEGIYTTAYELAKTYSYGGGCGVDISELRPRNAKVNNSAKETTGAVSFMQLYDMTTGLIGQNGRRGALMISIADSHPDLPEFLTIKSKEGSITKANISIRISDAFMSAVEYGLPWVMEFTVKDTGEVIKKVEDARKLYDTICQVNWDWAEDGMLFWDRITSHHMMSNHPKHKYAGVNPCAEEPLMADGSCLLGSQNLSKYVKHPFTENATFDHYKFGQDVMTAVIGLNEVLDEGLNRHPLEGQRSNAYLWRQIGLGVMGIADMLIKLGIKYGSKESLDLCNKIARFMLNQAVKQSSLLAKEYGAFPMYDAEALFSNPFFIENINEDVKELVRKYGIRNSQLLTIAPTGSISTMWGISGGIEPIFDISYTRKTESLYGKDVYFEVFTPIVKEYMTKHGITKKEDLPDFIIGSTTDKLDYKKRIEMQSVWQQYIDASISSTVNLPNSATVEDVYNIYMMAWKKGLKGITIYRKGCKREGILTVEPKVEAKKEVEPEYKLQDKFVTCQDCGEQIQLITNGCSICMNCGWSPCS